jgi:hypothetical protein
MKDIKSALNKIEKEEKTIEKIALFLKTKRGRGFVSKLYIQPFVQLCRIYNAPKFIQLYNNSTYNRNLVLAAIKKYNISIPSYTNTIAYTNTWSKTPVRLTKKEAKEMNARYPKKLGFAALMHAYEEHKVKRFEEKHPFLTETELSQDLFPEELIVQRKTQLYLYREYTRNFLCKVYSNSKIRENYYRVFLVYENKFNKKLYEKEGDPFIIGYPFAGCTEYTSLDRIKEILRKRAKLIKDAECVEVKVYNKYGTLLASARHNAQ